MHLKGRAHRHRNTNSCCRSGSNLQWSRKYLFGETQRDCCYDEDDGFGPTVWCHWKSSILIKTAAPSSCSTYSRRYCWGAACHAEAFASPRRKILTEAIALADTGCAGGATRRRSAAITGRCPKTGAAAVPIRPKGERACNPHQAS